MTSLFNCGLVSFLKEEALFISDGITEKKVSSRLSAQRELALLNQKQVAGQVTLYVAPLAPWHEIPPQVIWLNPFGQHSPSKANLIQSASEWQQFLFSLEGSEKFNLEIHPALPCREYLMELLQKDLKAAAARLKTIQHFQFLWPWNFKRNRSAWLAAEDWRNCQVMPPQAIVLGGPQADTVLEQMPRQANLWCADTALPALISRGFLPALVASIDAGFASLEHFAGVRLPRGNNPPLLLLDPFSVPALYRKVGWRIISYRNSHPLIQQEVSHHGELFNARGDVRGILEALYCAWFPQRELCPILGGEGCHLRGMSHLRGSAYQRRYLHLTHRLARFEGYSYLLSKRYALAKDK